MIFNLVTSKIKKYYIINLLQIAHNKGILGRKKVAMLLSLAETGKLVCKICGQPVQLHKASCDHKIPISKGGSKWNVRNYQLAHKGCNWRKGDKIL